MPTPAGQRLGLSALLGINADVDPLLKAAGAGDDEVPATYPDGSAAVVRRRRDDGPTYFVGAPGLSTELLRAAAREAGVHLITPQDCNVYANGPCFVLHAAQEGLMEVDVNRPGEVQNLLTRQELNTTALGKLARMAKVAVFPAISSSRYPAISAVLGDSAL